MAATALRIVGGTSIVGNAGVLELTRNGLPIAAVHAVLASGRLTEAELDRVVLPRKTLANRKRLGTLTPDQSDRLLRVARIIAAAEETFTTQAKAAAWLRHPTAALANAKAATECPLNLLDTDEGTRRVETLLGRIDHGIAA